VSPDPLSLVLGLFALLSLVRCGSSSRNTATTTTEREEWVMALKDIVPRAKIRRQAEKIVEKQEATLRRTTTQVSITS